jgi:predicted N-formylglutamate amidohydrolase
MGPLRGGREATEVGIGPRSDRLLITCEHGGRRVPPRYRALFAGHEDLLRTHRGWDFGALLLAREMARAMDAPLVASTTTRLLVDLNRSLGHPRLYSEITRGLPERERQAILARYYLPHRERVDALVRGALAERRRAVHVASHSFTPVLHGEVRQADVGLLYHPERPGEVALARRWLAALARLRPDLRLRRNYPYHGRSDALSSVLRRRHPDAEYVGLEIEVNQLHVLRGGDHWAALRRDLVASLQQAVDAQVHASVA